ncbi:MAG: aminomethyltransferase family protein [Haloarculaceae archaeon]
MTLIEAVHEAHGAAFTDRGGRRVVADYGRPERTHRAVRNGVGVAERWPGVLVLTGDDRVEFVDNAVSNRVPATDGRGTYALLLDPQGSITTDMYVFTAGERLLVLLPPSRAQAVADDWAEKTFIQDVDVAVATDEFAVFGVHGPSATEKVASVLNGSGTPDDPLSFVRGSMVDAGVTVIRDDGLTGEEGYLVVCAADLAADVFDTLLHRGMNAVPFGAAVWDALTLEAGTPLFETELRGRLPNVVGVRNALDFQKGCYVGQEVVSRVENRGRPNQRLVGLAADRLPDAGATVAADGEHVGEVTRAVESTSRDEPIAFAAVDYDLEAVDLTVGTDGADADATVVDLPFVEGSDRSARLPTYPEA